MTPGRQVGGVAGLAVAHLPDLAGSAAILAFFVAVAVLTFNGVWPRGLTWLAILGAVINLAALAGFASLDGPPNSGNGLLGGLAGPVATWVIWIAAVSVHWLRHPEPVTAAPRERT